MCIDGLVGQKAKKNTTTYLDGPHYSLLLAIHGPVVALEDTVGGCRVGSGRELSEVQH